MNKKRLYLISLILLNLLGGMNLLQRLLKTLNSDSLYPLVLYRDLFIDGFSLSGWVLPPAPYFFPDLFILFPLIYILPAMGIAMIGYGLFVISINITFISKLLHPLIHNRTISLTAALITNLLIMSFMHTSRGLQLAEIILLPSFHGGAFVAGLILLMSTFSQSMYKHPMLYYSSIFLITFFSAVSDLIFIVQFIIPLIITAICFYPFLPISKRQLLFTNAILILSTLIGRFFISTLITKRIITVIKPNLYYNQSWQDIMNSLTLFGHDIFNILLQNPGFLVIQVIYIVLTFHFIYSRVKQKSNPLPALTIWHIFTLISIAFTITPPILTGLWMSQTEIRYIIPFFLFPAWTVAAYAISFSILHKKKAIVFTNALIITYAILNIFSDLTKIRPTDFTLPYPAKVKYIDSIARKHNLTHGFSDYWNAKYLTFHSKEDIRINQLHNSLIPYFWINNRDWYWKTPKGQGKEKIHYRFIITNRLNKALIIKHCGNPSIIEKNEGLEIFIYKDDLNSIFKQLSERYFR